MIRTKRVYEPPSADDGLRVLVDRIWPRGVKRETAAIDRWAKEIAPSHELRKWFGHAPSRWQEFQARYRLELQSPAAASVLTELREIAGKRTITLVFAASQLSFNNAEALRQVLEHGAHEAG